MLSTVYQMSDFTLFISLSGFFLVGSVLVICVLRCLIPHETRFKENAIIGSVSALISLIFGVLAGLIALYLINTISFTAEAVQREANATANIYRDTRWLTPPKRDEIRAEIRHYLEHTIRNEWPGMKQGVRPGTEGGAIIDNISNQLADYVAAMHPDSAIISNFLDSLKQLYDSRQLRVQSSTIELGPEIWLVIVIGAILTVGINCLYGMNFYLHLASASAAALMVSSVLFLLIVLDKPYQGEFGVTPNELQNVLNHITDVVK